MTLERPAAVTVWRDAVLTDSTITTTTTTTMTVSICYTSEFSSRSLARGCVTPHSGALALAGRENSPANAPPALASSLTGKVIFVDGGSVGRKMVRRRLRRSRRFYFFLLRSKGTMGGLPLHVTPACPPVSSWKCPIEPPLELDDHPLYLFAQF